MMRGDAAAVVAVLVLIEVGVLWAAARRPALFKLMPPLFWIYFLPTIAGAVGLVPTHHALYEAAVHHLLPASLALLFLSVNVPAILKLGPLALGTMAVSSSGIFLGGPVITLLLGRWLPRGAWAGLGALSASWMGGSANMVAVKASIGTPDPIFAQVVVVDVVVAYSWMALLMALAPHQRTIDRLTRARADSPDLFAVRPASPGRTAGWHPAQRAAMVAIAAGGSAVATTIGRVLPTVAGVVAPFTWTVIGVTAIGVALSFTAARELERFGASRLGYFLLFFVLACIGAQAELAALRRAPLFIAAGVLWLLFHALTLLVGGRVLRAPAFLLAAASQANVGGPVSAPIVADAYRPGLAGVGLLLAVLGNLSGTYLGILCSLVCKALG